MEGGYNLDRQSRHFEGEPETRVKWNQGLPPVGTPAASGISTAGLHSPGWGTPWRTMTLQSTPKLGPGGKMGAVLWMLA